MRWREGWGGGTKQLRNRWKTGEITQVSKVPAPYKPENWSSDTLPTCKMLNTPGHTWNPSTWKAERCGYQTCWTGELQVQWVITTQKTKVEMDEESHPMSVCAFMLTCTHMHRNTYLTVYKYRHTKETTKTQQMFPWYPVNQVHTKDSSLFRRLWWKKKPRRIKSVISGCLQCSPLLYRVPAL